jgi:hypothetical protein
VGILQSFNSFLAEHRRRRRWLVLFPAAIDGGTGERPADVVNLSTTGAMLYCEPPPRLNSRLELIWAGRRDVGMVVWVQGRRCGFRFDKPVPEAAIVRVSGGNQPD